MKEKTELAAVTMHADLSQQHLTSRRPRLTAKEVMERVCKRYGYTPTSIYRFLRKHRPSMKLS